MMGSLLFLGYSIYSQLYKISFYEKQGVFIYPGAKKWMLGNMNAIWDYMIIRKSNEVVPNPVLWMLHNVKQYAEKKEDVPSWIPVTLIHWPLTTQLYVADPYFMQTLQEDKTLWDKDSFLAYLCDKRTNDNIFAMRKCPAQ